MCLKTRRFQTLKFAKSWNLACRKLTLEFPSRLILKSKFREWNREHTSKQDFMQHLEWILLLILAYDGAIRIKRSAWETMAFRIAVAIQQPQSSLVSGNKRVSLSRVSTHAGIRAEGKTAVFSARRARSECRATWTARETGRPVVAAAARRKVLRRARFRTLLDAFDNGPPVPAYLWGCRLYYKPPTLLTLVNNLPFRLLRFARLLLLFRSFALPARNAGLNPVDRNIPQEVYNHFRGIFHATGKTREVVRRCCVGQEFSGGGSIRSVKDNRRRGVVRSDNILICAKIWIFADL